MRSNKKKPSNHFYKGNAKLNHSEISVPTHQSGWGLRLTSAARTWSCRRRCFQWGCVGRNLLHDEYIKTCIPAQQLRSLVFAHGKLKYLKHCWEDFYSSFAHNSQPPETTGRINCGKSIHGYAAEPQKKNELLEDTAPVSFRRSCQGKGDRHWSVHVIWFQSRTFWSRQEF